MREDYNRFRQRQAEVLVVGTDEHKSFDYHWKRHGYPFVGLADAEGQVPDLYGQEVKLLKLGRLPALMVIDRAGMIRYAHYGESMSDIPSNHQVLQLLDELNAEQQQTVDSPKE